MAEDLYLARIVEKIKEHATISMGDDASSHRDEIVCVFAVGQVRITLNQILAVRGGSKAWWIDRYSHAAQFPQPLQPRIPGCRYDFVPSPVQSSGSLTLPQRDEMTINLSLRQYWSQPLDSCKIGKGGLRSITAIGASSCFFHMQVSIVQDGFRWVNVEFTKFLDARMLAKYSEIHGVGPVPSMVEIHT